MEKHKFKCMPCSFHTLVIGKSKILQTFKHHCQSFEARWGLSYECNMRLETGKMNAVKSLNRYCWFKNKIHTLKTRESRVSGHSGLWFTNFSLKIVKMQGNIPKR